MFTVPSFASKSDIYSKEEKKKKKKKNKMSIPWLPSLPPPAAPRPPGFNPGWGQVAGQPLSDEVSNIERHLFNGGVVEGLDVSKSPLVFFCYHVNSHTFAPKTTTTTNSGKQGQWSGKGNEHQRLSIVRVGQVPQYHTHLWM
jgi:hypothetical protein